MPVTFLTKAKLQADIAKWSMDLPRDLSMIVGIPRSGMLVATQLALFRNLPVMPLPQFLGWLKDQETIKPRRGYAHGWRAMMDEHVLVVDDSLLRGRTMQANRAKVQAATGGLQSLGIRNDFPKISYGAVYTLPGAEGQVDFSFESVPQRRLMEWNFMHSHVQMAKAVCDFDGVFCEDWDGQEQDEDPTYVDFIINARPLLLPTAPVKAICTGRLERYRDVTVAWLEKHHVQYEELHMHPASKASYRRAGTPRHAVEIKAHLYKDARFNLFVESHPKHAKRIAELTGKPAIATDTMALFQ